MNNPAPIVICEVILIPVHAFTPSGTAPNDQGIMRIDTGVKILKKKPNSCITFIGLGAKIYADYFQRAYPELAPRIAFWDDKAKMTVLDIIAAAPQIDRYCHGYSSLLANAPRKLKARMFRKNIQLTVVSHKLHMWRMAHVLKKLGYNKDIEKYESFEARDRSNFYELIVNAIVFLDWSCSWIGKILVWLTNNRKIS